VPAVTSDGTLIAHLSVTVTSSIEATQTVESDTPFASIEEAREYVILLAEAVEEARGSIQAEMDVARATESNRRIDVLQLTDYKLGQLQCHFNSSRRILNDLRTLRRLLHNERADPNTLLA
jgi:hypothetical protein